MDVAEAMYRRISVRDFLPDPVDDELLRRLLTDASFAASGGNVQPWRIYVVNGESMTRFREYLTTQPPVEEPEYDIYPKGLTEPYRTSRFELGEQMYALMGIPREDKPARLRQFARNGDFFGAPAGLFCFIDRQMGPPQWSDLGMFLQSFMLLATEAGLSTCAQEYWSVRHGAVQQFVGAPENEMLFCGMAIGYPNPDNPVNTLRSQRTPLDTWATFV